MIVDIGTGPGLWVIEVADEFETAKVYGIDISPVEQHTNGPINAEFRLMDLNEGINFDDGSTDLVHSRYQATYPSFPDLDLYMPALLNPNGQHT